MALLAHFQGLVGIVLIPGLAWLMSEDRAAVPRWTWVAGALALQLGIAIVVTRVPLVWSVVAFANRGVAAIERATLVGSSYMFGHVGGAPIPFVLEAGEAPPVIIAFQILPLIIVFSAVAALLWHWGVLRAIVRAFSWALRRTLGVSGVVGLGGGATLFLGVIETPLILRAWFGRMSRADLFMVMVLSMATISGAVLVLYAATLARTVPGAVGHMIVASLISAPAALLIARLMVPGPPTEQAGEVEPDLSYDSSIDAVIKATLEGVQLVLAVAGVIIVAFALVALVDEALALLPGTGGAPLSLKRLFSWVFAPLMWAIGIPWRDAAAAGALMGTKAILNEYVAYLQLAALPAGTLGPRSLLIVTYALCGFANLASIGLLVSTISTLAPTRRGEVAELGVRSWIAGNLASSMTGAVIGLVTWS